MPHRGFSLIEILLAMAISLVLITGTAELIVYSGGAKKKADMTAGLMHTLSTRLEKLKSLPFDSEGLQPGTYSENVEDGLSRERFRQEWAIAEIAEGTKTISIRAGSIDHPRTRAFLVLYISRDLGFRP